MTRRALPIALAIVSIAIAPLAAPLSAQVGHTPADSPFEDLRGKQGLTIWTGLGVIEGPPPVTMSDAVMTNTWTFGVIAMAGTTGSLPGTPLP